MASSPLAGSLARTIGSAMSTLFLPATLKQGTNSYPCRAIFEEYGCGLGAEAIRKTAPVKILALATSLSIKPAMGDVVTISNTTFAEGFAFVVYSGSEKPAVSIDPAGAVWVLRCRAAGVLDGGSDPQAEIAVAMGKPHMVYRPVPGYDPLAEEACLIPIKALFADGGGSGFNFNRSLHDNDVVQNALVDAQGLLVGDYLVRLEADCEAVPRTYFIASMEPERPINAILCNRTITLARNNSQVDADGGQAEGLPSQDGGPGRYWGVTRDPDDDTEGPGEFTTARNVPVALLSLAGASREQGNVPSDSAGPARWRAFLPQSVFPLGSVSTRDIVTDDEGERYQCSSAGWTNLGYRLELVRMEN